MADMDMYAEVLQNALAQGSVSRLVCISTFSLDHKRLSSTRALGIYRNL